MNKERENCRSKEYYFWQPELYLSLISWSATFFVLFVSLIMSLENNQPYLASNVVLGLFFLLVICGVQRRFRVVENHLEIIYFIPLKREKILLKEIYQVIEGPKGIRLILKNKKETRTFMMKEKSRKRFIQRLKTHPEISIDVQYDKNLSTSKD